MTNTELPAFCPACGRLYASSSTKLSTGFVDNRFCQMGHRRPGATLLGVARRMNCAALVTHRGGPYNSRPALHTRSRTLRS